MSDSPTQDGPTQDGPTQDGRMSDDTAEPILARFEISGYTESKLDGVDGDWAAGITFHKTFTHGIVGSSVVHFVSSGGEGRRGYIAVERITGTLDDGRSGSFTVQHGGCEDPAVFGGFGYIVPGTGTDDLVGIAGTARIDHDDRGPFFMITPA